MSLHIDLENFEKISVESCPKLEGSIVYIFKGEIIDLVHTKMTDWICRMEYSVIQGSGRGKRMGQQIVETHIVWLNEQKRIASFHQVDGYQRRMLFGHDSFVNFLYVLVECGYRLQ